MQKMPQECTEDHIWCHTYKEGPPGRANGRATQDARHGQHLGPPVSLLEKGALGVGRPQGSAEPGWPPVQVHPREE